MIMPFIFLHYTLLAAQISMDLQHNPHLPSICPEADDESIEALEPDRYWVV